jgi:phenylalanyl-tRNA synthetase alpha chain
METGGENLGALEREARDAAASVASLQALRELRARFLGRKSPVAALLRGIGEREPAERARLGQQVQAAQQRLEALFDARRLELERAEQERALAERRIDVSLPGAAPARGALHPVTLIEREMTAFFTSMGFSVEEGPEVEDEWHCFDALNTPPDHPARDVHDTFFVGGGRVLRTHTSTVQIRVMTGRQPPFRFVTLGRVYRHDYDATHAPMFHQIEGFLVDERVTMADLKGVLFAFARHLLGPDVQLRFRGHFFPYTEPSAEIDFSWKGGWLEWGGCGMIHPRVLENCGIDPARWQGFAFGMGIDRSAMLRFGVPNIHLLFDGDARVLGQFR